MALPRVYAATEWLKLEFRAVGDALTITADGVIIGTVKDATLSDTGTATIHAGANGFFRDIEYVPLDKQPAASSAPKLPVSAPSTPATSYRRSLISPAHQAPLTAPAPSRTPDRAWD